MEGPINEQLISIYRTDIYYISKNGRFDQWTINLFDKRMFYI